jgi:hypothetical protein
MLCYDAPSMMATISSTTLGSGVKPTRRERLRILDPAPSQQITGLLLG